MDDPQKPVVLFRPRSRTAREKRIGIRSVFEQESFLRLLVSRHGRCRLRGLPHLLPAGRLPAPKGGAVPAAPWHSGASCLPHAAQSPPGSQQSEERCSTSGAAALWWPWGAAAGLAFTALGPHQNRRSYVSKLLLHLLRQKGNSLKSRYFQSPGGHSSGASPQRCRGEVPAPRPSGRPPALLLAISPWPAISWGCSFSPRLRGGAGAGRTVSAREPPRYERLVTRCPPAGSGSQRHAPRENSDVDRPGRGHDQRQGKANILT